MTDSGTAAYLRRLALQDAAIRQREVDSSRREGRAPRDSFPFLQKISNLAKEINSGAEYRVTSRFRADASEAEYVEFALRGYALTVDPREIFDLSWLGDSLALFKVIRILGDPVAYTGWDALESMDAVERFSIAGDPPVPIRLDNLTNLHTLSIAGLNVVSAAKNPSIRDLGLGFPTLPAGFVVEVPLESINITAKDGDVDFRFIDDASQLSYVQVSAASSVSLEALARATHLRRLELENCRLLTHAIALSGLKELESVEFNGLRAVDDLEALAWFSSKRIWAEKNFLFDREFIRQAGGASRNWNVEKYRGPIRDDEQADSQDHSPFFVRPYGDKLFQVAFDDWEAYQGIFEGKSLPAGDMCDQLDYFAQETIRSTAPAILRIDEVYFDSDAESMRLITPYESMAHYLAGILATAWTDTAAVEGLIGRAT